VHHEILQQAYNNSCFFTDPFDVDGMYIKVSEEKNKPRWVCKRGTSPLEGYHGHLAAVLKGSNYSAALADILIKIFNFRWNVGAAIRNKKEHDFGMFNFVLLHSIKNVCINSGFADPLPQFTMLPRLVNPSAYSPETFGVLDVPPARVQQNANQEVEDAAIDLEAKYAAIGTHNTGVYVMTWLQL
jgi:hypothetical protein